MCAQWFLRPRGPEAHEDSRQYALNMQKERQGH
jgi:hypothetical protein